MQRYCVKGLLPALLAILLFPAYSVFGSELKDLPRGVRWRQSKITLSLSRSFEGNPNVQGPASEALDKSISLWTAEAAIRFEIVETEAQSVSARGVRGDGVSLITAAMTAENVRLFPNQASSPAAVTRIFRDSRGNLTEADIVLNPFVRFSTDGTFDTFDLVDTLTHEIGHLLGLAHSEVWGSIMFDRRARGMGPSSFTGERKTLPRVDAASIMAIYGPNPSNSAVCCDSVSGRITGLGASSQVLVWLEDRTSGRVAAAGRVQNDGTYRIDGVSEGEYNVLVFAVGVDDVTASGSSRVTVNFERESRSNFVAKPRRLHLQAKLLGTTPQLARLPVKLTDRTSTLFLGFRGSSEGVSRVGISSTDVLFNSILESSYSMAASLKVLSFAVPTDANLSSGEYTLVVEDKSGARQFLVGALVVE